MAFYPSGPAFWDLIAERQGKGGESAPAAIFGWVRRLFVGLWSFLRGADLEPRPALAVLPAAPTTRTKRSTAESPPAGDAAPDTAGDLVAEDDDEDFDD